MSHKVKYFVKSYRNKVKSSGIRGMWKKKKHVVEEPVSTEENILLID